MCPNQPRRLANVARAAAIALNTPCEYVLARDKPSHPSSDPDTDQWGWLSADGAPPRTSPEVRLWVPGWRESAQHLAIVA